jgi:hypothetical protein
MLPICITVVRTMETTFIRRRHKYEPPSFLMPSNIRSYREPLEYNLKLVHKPEEVDLAVQEIYRLVMT